MKNMGARSYRYYNLLYGLFECLINVFLLKEEENIKKINSMLEEEITVIYLLIVGAYGKDEQISKTFEFIIKLNNFLNEKYHNRLLNINLMSLSYYAVDEKVQEFKKNINENLFVEIEVEEVLNEFIKVAEKHLNVIYKEIHNRLESILSTNSKSLDFIRKHKKELYKQIIVREKDMEDRKNIFISYTHKDELMVFKIRDRFKLSNLDIWIDEENIKPAGQISKDIRKGIENSDYILLFDSEDSRNSSYVNEELKHALAVRSKMNKPIIIPILINVNKTREDIEEIKDIKGIDISNLDICMLKIFEAIDAKFIAIKVAELNTLLMLLEKFVEDIWWCHTADYNMCIDEEMFVNLESFENYLNEKWLFSEDNPEYSFIRERNGGIEFDWNFYNSNRLAIISAHKLKYVDKLFKTIIKNSDDDLYSIYESILNS